MLTSFCTDENKLYAMYVVGENTTVLLSFGTLAEIKKEAKEYFVQMTKKVMIVNVTRMDGKLFTIRAERTAGPEVKVTYGELKSVS